MQVSIGLLLFFLNTAFQLYRSLGLDLICAHRIAFCSHEGLRIAILISTVYGISWDRATICVTTIHAKLLEQGQARTLDMMSPSFAESEKRACTVLRQNRSSVSTTAPEQQVEEGNMSTSSPETRSLVVPPPPQTNSSCTMANSSNKSFFSSSNSSSSNTINNAPSPQPPLFKKEEEEQEEEEKEATKPPQPPTFPSHYPILSPFPLPHPAPLPLSPLSSLLLLPRARHLLTSSIHARLLLPQDTHGPPLKLLLDMLCPETPGQADSLLLNFSFQIEGVKLLRLSARARRAVSLLWVAQVAGLVGLIGAGWEGVEAEALRVWQSMVEGDALVRSGEDLAGVVEILRREGGGGGG